MIRDYGYRAWSRIVGYGGRWMAETAISRFKALFGEHLLSRKPRWMDSELTIKALIYNMILSAVTTRKLGPSRRGENRTPGIRPQGTDD